MAKASPTTEIILALNEMRWVLRTLMFFCVFALPPPAQEGRPLGIFAVVGGDGLLALTLVPAISRSESICGGVGDSHTRPARS